jgi:hypothetical protein
MAVIKGKARGKMRLWANLRYSTALCLGGVEEHYKKKTKFSVPGPRFESDTTQNTLEAYTRRIRDICRSRGTTTTVSPKTH